MPPEDLSAQSLSEEVRTLILRWHIDEANRPRGDHVPDPVELDVDMFRPLVVDGVLGELVGGAVVDLDNGGEGPLQAKVLQQLTDPHDILHTEETSDVFRLHGRHRNNRLQLG